jgi:hypothetical protein
MEWRMAVIAKRFTRAGMLALALAASAAETVAAQAWWLRGPDAAFIAMGVSGVALGELDDELAERGYPTFGRTALAPAIGAYWKLSSGLMLGGEWGGIILGEETHDGREVGVGGGYATLGAGYAMELSSRARLYPRLGFGGGGFGLWFESEEEEVAFDEALADPRPAPDDESVLNRASAVVDLGAGAEFRPIVGGAGPLVALRLGYIATPFSTGWTMDDRPLSGGPAATIAGPYVRVVIGWGVR